MSVRGFTLIELLVVIAVIGILATIVLAGLTSVRAKGRYASVIKQLESIYTAVEVENNITGSYPPDANTGVMPTGLSAYLSAWPSPPCPGWTYDWDNWTNGTQLYVTLRDSIQHPIVYYCVFDSLNRCSPLADGPNIISNWPSKAFTCNEQGI